ncbi:DNA-binding XRE family transcriptional regulator [Paenibacillus taihuensis]|uniref:DNA-binding XRE family transcriptional regulator n=1 Tax=Paenibacillus taihuensis TaxID=1156355 RepID=A0A3D9SKU1_9BACL|nr:helix-turn-helix transcriptional regulator [Paenibacillus taihuensis]REE90612.1 DNA-binding XRE family transcriptional regulator [Paenibacillus taihuensis]
MELENLFGDLLKQARLKAGMTQETLAFQAELDRTYISLLETGKRQPTLMTLFALSKALELRPSDIIKEIEKKVGYY